MQEYSDNLLNSVVEKFQSGRNCVEISKILRLSKQKVRSILISKGIKVRNRGHKVTPEERSLWLELYNKGTPLSEMAKQADLAVNTIRTHLKMAGVPQRVNKIRVISFSAEQEKLILDMYSLGLSISDCMFKTGLERRTVIRIIKTQHKHRPGRLLSKKVISIKEQKKIVRLFKCDWTIAMIAEIYEVTNNEIQAILILNDIKIETLGQNCISFIDRKYRIIEMKNPWEVKYAQYLDKKEINWDYKKESYQLEDSTYTPDFFIYNKEGKLEKVVDIAVRYTYVAINRVSLFRKTHPNLNLTILTEGYLNKLELIKLVGIV